MLDRIALSCARRRGAVLLAILLVSCAMAYGASQVRQTSDYKKFLSSDQPSVRVTLLVAEEFPGMVFETVLVEGENLLKAGALREVLYLENFFSSPALENRVVGYQSYADLLLQHLPQVRELLQDPSNDPLVESLVMGAYLTFMSSPQASAQLAGYLTPDLRAGKMVVYLNSSLPKEELVKAVEVMEERLKGVEGLDLGLTGSYSMERDIGRLMSRDNRVLMPATFLFITLLLFLTFRRFSDVGRCLLVVGLAALWTMGVMGLTGADFTSIHVALVPISMVAGIDYSLYLLSRYYEERKRGEGVEVALGTSARRVGGAVLMCFLTTVIGFLSFSISDLPPVRTLGQFAALAVGFAFLLTLVLLPALARRGEVGAGGREGGVSRGLASVGRGIVRHRRIILAGLAVTVALSALVAPRVSSTMSFDLLLPSGVESLQTQHRIEELFGGQSQLFVLVQGDFLQPQALQQLLALEQGVREDPRAQGLVGGSYSVADAVLMFSGSLPPTREAVLAVLENLRESNHGLLLPFSGDKTIVVFSVLGRTDRDFKKVTEVVRDHVENFSSQLVSLRVDGAPAVGGAPAVISDLFSRVLPNMVKTTVLALVACFLVLVLLFRSPVLGALTIFPVCMVVVWELGTFYLLGWSLDVFTLGSFSLMIGMGIDYSVQLSSRLREELGKEGSPEEAASRTAGSIGRAVLASAVTMGGGFLILSLSRMPAMTRFGELVALVIFYAFLAAVLFLPSVLTLRSGRKKGR
ncbi:MAG: efflux RND transporter permease subunit [Candidatus Hadarchaeales archaeon]